MTKTRFPWPSAALMIGAVLLLIGFTAFAQAVNTATISFTAPTARVDTTPIVGTVSYKVYQGVKGAAKTVVGTITTTGLTINTGLASGSEYCWQVTATETLAGVSGPESARSNEACKAFAPGSAPGVVTITVT